jgi:hypothetical protein
MPLDSANGNGQGDLTLPENAACLTCEFSELVQVIGPQGEISVGQTQRVCRRFPPVPVMLPIQMGAQMGAGLRGVTPPVRDEDFCFEYSERAEPEVEPTGLFTGGESAND